jgi:hypothetical protein
MVGLRLDPMVWGRKKFALRTLLLVRQPWPALQQCHQKFFLANAVLHGQQDNPCPF